MCSHDKDMEFTTGDVCRIFKKSYVTIMNWLGKKHDGHYPNGDFPNAYKCPECKRIYIPYVDVDAKMETYRRNVR